MAHLHPAVIADLDRLAAQVRESPPPYLLLDDCFDRDSTLALDAAVAAGAPLAEQLDLAELLAAVSQLTGIADLALQPAAGEGLAPPALILVIDLHSARTGTTAARARCLIVDAAVITEDVIASLLPTPLGQHQARFALAPAPPAAPAPELPPYALLHLAGVGSAHANGHFYSPICDPEDLLARRDEIWPANVPDCLGIDFDDASHLKVLDEWFPRFIGDYDYPEHGPEDSELSFFYTQNSQFSWLDSRALFVLMRALAPRRMIEVGSGYSSLLMADINCRFFDSAIDIRCVEPYPREFLTRGVPGLREVIVERVQQVPLATFEALEANDILFIDSSHVAKTGSDVNYLFFEVLPRLKAGVVIHVHDIFLPADYIQSWAIDQNRSWNEQYLLRALLMHSTAFKTMFGCYYAWLRHPQRVRQALASPSGHAFGGGSYWLRRL